MLENFFVKIPKPPTLIEKLMIILFISLTIITNNAMISSPASLLFLLSASGIEGIIKKWKKKNYQKM